mmetsp:Transcript_30568/g.41865  ORF Transcript_30568/g.41865 Transcript_30568/m.41865 type:complete len:242 (+) Transcript_30568:76-801(+)|eukprot:CAMPEP_0170076462 /NCGR_PEP_ID=MMETSP0019_2-20121128/13453_1 /TAXON_ID=98059 /ORGANISM="Dinobryon sp., Strain UTEXLB2267" /LENGTH=241 /DNA_ID=CAMNT_0010288163 /DNA_START=186 /DNA_END=911 /DNA_ORIENTATION=+
MSALLAIDIEQVRADAIAHGRVPPGGKTTISLGNEGNSGSFSPRRNRTFESSLFKDSSEVPASPDRPAKKSSMSSPKPSISECFKTAEPVSRRPSGGIAFSKNGPKSASKLLCKSYSKTFQSSLFSDDDDQPAPVSSPRSAKKPVNSAPKTHIGPVFDRTSNQENNMNQTNTVRPSKKPTVDEKSSMKQVFDKNTPTKRKPSKKAPEEDKTTMNLVLSQVKLENTSRVRMSPGGPTAILLA